MQLMKGISDAYRMGPKKGNRRPLFTAGVKRGMMKAATFVPATAAIDKDVAAFVRYAISLRDYENRKS